MSARGQRHFTDELHSLIDRFVYEYDMTYIELIGSLDAVKFDLQMESRQVEEEHDE